MGSFTLLRCLQGSRFISVSSSSEIDLKLSTKQFGHEYRDFLGCGRALKRGPSNVDLDNCQLFPCIQPNDQSQECGKKSTLVVDYFGVSCVTCSVLSEPIKNSMNYGMAPSMERESTVGYAINPR